MGAERETPAVDAIDAKASHLDLRVDGELIRFRETLREWDERNFNEGR